MRIILPSRTTQVVFARAVRILAELHDASPFKEGLEESEVVELVAFQRDRMRMALEPGALRARRSHGESRGARSTQKEEERGCD